MNTDGVYGYNVWDADVVTERMIGHGANILTYLVDDIQKNFVNPMSENWVCKEAQDFFNNFKEKDEQLATRVNTRLHEFYETMRDASDTWAQQTGGRSIARWTQNYVPNIDVSNFKEQVNGIRGINMKNVPEIMNTFNVIIDKTKEEMRQIKELTQNVPFLGADQQEKLVQLIEIIALDISDSIASFRDETQMIINDTLTKYGDTAAMVSEKLSDSYK